VQFVDRRVGGGSLPSFQRRPDARAVRPEARQQCLEKGDARAGLQLVIAGEDLPRQRHPGTLPANRQKLFAQFGETLGIGETGRLVPALDQRAAAFGDGLQQLAEERGVHPFALRPRPH
jgi:hypothetical protein